MTPEQGAENTSVSPTLGAFSRRDCFSTQQIAATPDNPSDWTGGRPTWRWLCRRWKTNWSSRYKTDVLFPKS